MTNIFESSIIVYDEYGKKIDGIWEIPDNTIQSIRKFTKSNGNFLSQNKTIYVSWVELENKEIELKKTIRLELKNIETDNFVFNFDLSGHTGVLKDVKNIFVRKIGKSTKFSWDSSMLKYDAKYLIFKNNQYVEYSYIEEYSETLTENQKVTYKILAEDKDGIVTRATSSSIVTLNDNEDESLSVSSTTKLSNVIGKKDKNAPVPDLDTFKVGEDYKSMFLSWAVLDPIRIMIRSFQIDIVERDNDKNKKTITIENKKPGAVRYEYTVTGLDENKSYNLYVRSIMKDTPNKKGGISYQSKVAIKRTRSINKTKEKISQGISSGVKRIQSNLPTNNNTLNKNNFPIITSINLIENKFNTVVGEKAYNIFQMQWEHPKNKSDVQKYLIYVAKPWALTEKLTKFKDTVELTTTKNLKLVKEVAATENKTTFSHYVDGQYYMSGIYYICSVVNGVNSKLMAYIGNSGSKVPMEIRGYDRFGLEKYLDTNKLRTYEEVMPPIKLNIEGFNNNLNGFAQNTVAVLSWEHYNQSDNNILGEGYEYVVYQKIDNKFKEIDRTSIGLSNVELINKHKTYMFCVVAIDKLTGKKSQPSNIYSIIPSNWERKSSTVLIPSDDLLGIEDLSKPNKHSGNYKKRDFSTKTQLLKTEVFNNKKQEPPYNDDQFIRIYFKNSPIYFDFWFESIYFPEYKRYAYLFDSNNKKLTYEQHFFDGKDYILKTQQKSLKQSQSTIPSSNANWMSGFEPHTKVHKTIAGQINNSFSVIVRYIDDKQNKFYDTYVFESDVFQKYQEILKYKK